MPTAEPSSTITVHRLSTPGRSLLRLRRKVTSEAPAATKEFLRRKVAPDIPLAAKEKQIMAIMRLSSRVAPEPPLITEQKRAQAMVVAKIRAHSSASASTRHDDIFDDAVPTHLLRPESYNPLPAPPFAQLIYELTLFALDPVASKAAGASFRVAKSDDDGDEVDLRRRRIYALNAVLQERQRSEWIRYRGNKRGQMAALEACLAAGANTASRRGLAQLSQRVAVAMDDERQHAQQQAIDEGNTLEYCIACIVPCTEDDKELVRAMPVDSESGAARSRYCPWASTADGCPRLSSCPLSHRPLPERLVTFKFRCWALEKHNGWTGEGVEPLPST